MSRHLRLTVVRLTISLLSIAAMGQAPPNADTYVSSLRPDANFGSSPILAVQEGTTTYVRFDLSSFPDSANLSKATLRLYVNSVLRPGSFDVYPVNDGWSEKTLNYYNAPLLGASATGGHPINISLSSIGQFIVADITSLVQGWLTGATTNNGVALALAEGSIGNTGSFSFDSKEDNLTGHQPELVLAIKDEAQPCAATGGAARNDFCAKYNGWFCCRCGNVETGNTGTSIPCPNATCKGVKLMDAHDACVTACAKCDESYKFDFPRINAVYGGGDECLPPSR